MMRLCRRRFWTGIDWTRCVLAHRHDGGCAEELDSPAEVMRRGSWVALVGSASPTR